MSVQLSSDRNDEILNQPENAIKMVKTNRDGVVLFTVFFLKGIDP